jgi:hypothetical protein
VEGSNSQPASGAGNIEKAEHVVVHARTGTAQEQKATPALQSSPTPHVAFEIYLTGEKKSSNLV